MTPGLSFVPLILARRSLVASAHSFSGDTGMRPYARVTADSRADAGNCGTGPCKLMVEHTKKHELSLAFDDALRCCAQHRSDYILTLKYRNSV